MDLTTLLAGLATRAAHVLVIEAPAGWATRVALERAARQRRWVLADSPADADVLAVCGVPGPELAEVIENVWDQMPGPRARLELVSWPGAQVLDDVVSLLEDAEHQQQEARERSGPESPSGMDHEGMDHEGMDHEGMDHEGMDHGDMDHEGMDHGDMDHEGMDHGDMDHGDMEMAPHGIPLAEGGDDRDGLEMDVLHVTLGPVLPHWPAGLALRCALQGDVVTEADARWVDAESGDGGDRPVPDDQLSESKEQRAARWCDDASQLLALAGWGRVAAEARSVRDGLVADPPAGDAAARLNALQRKVASSRMLRWSLRGIGLVTPQTPGGHRTPPAAPVGDVHDRLLVMLRQARAELGDLTATSPGQPREVAGMPLDALESAVTGLDLAAVRLVVASLAPLLDRQGVPTHA